MMRAIFLVIFGTACSTIQIHSEVSKHFPYALIGSDFGILNEDDMAIPSCVAEPSPFSAESNDYPYWQCFSLVNASVDCSHSEYDSSEKTNMTIMAIVLQKNGVTNEYLSRRAISVKSCQNYANRWKELTSGQKYTCVLGSFLSRNFENKAIQRWIFESYKTLRGCDSYFKGGCNLKYQKENDGCEFLTSFRNRT